MFYTASNLERSLGTTLHQKMYIRFRTWNARSLYRTGSLKGVPRELGKHKLNLLQAQEVRCEKSGTELAEDYTFF
jgi:hypothetical protein